MARLAEVTLSSKREARNFVIQSCMTCWTVKRRLSVLCHVPNDLKPSPSTRLCSLGIDYRDRTSPVGFPFQFPRKRLPTHSPLERPFRKGLGEDKSIPVCTAMTSHFTWHRAYSYPGRDAKDRARTDKNKSTIPNECISAVTFSVRVGSCACGARRRWREPT